MWIPVTLLGALLQTVRTAQQQRLRALMSVNAAGFVRYAYGAPVSALAVAVGLLLGHPFPSPPTRFWPFIVGAGVLQIVATNLLIRTFSLRSYALGTVYSKTEIVQVAVFSAVFLGESLRLTGWIGALACFAGVAWLALAKSAAAPTRWFDATAWVGLAAGGCFGLCAVLLRAGSRSLGDAPAVWRALVTLFVMNASQVLINGVWLAVQDSREFRKVYSTWRTSGVVGLMSVGGSACWAIAMTWQNAARVRTVGQVELLFTFAIARIWFGERQTRSELLASGLIAIGVIVVMAGG